MKRTVLAVAAFALLASVSTPLIKADTPVTHPKVLTRFDKLSGTQWVIVVSSIPNEITSITCDKWIMLGVGSWKHQNDFTIPAAPPLGFALGVIDANKYQGYCEKHGSIIAHTDDGDFIGTLDRGDGNWNASTKLTFSVTPQ
jgi:hypothetical protein